MIPIYKPHIPKKSIEYAHEAISSSWISSTGKYIDLASQKLSEESNCEYVVLTNTGTSATHLVTRTLKRFTDTKRVLVPSACYVAVYNSLLYDLDDFGWDIVCVDLDKDTWNMKIDEVRKGDTIFAVHNLGNIINVPRLIEEYNCTVIEDNCEGFFGTYQGYPSGSKSLCSSLSFFGNKNVTCGEGGAYMTNEKDAYDFARKLWGQGQTEQRYIHDELGYNYRMTNVQAALLLGQLEELDYIKENKKRVFDRYRKNLNGVDGVSLQKLEENTTHSMWMNAVKLENKKSYEESKRYFDSWEIDTRPMFYPHTTHKHISFSGNSEEAEDINNKVVMVPSYPELTNDEIDYICEKIINH